MSASPTLNSEPGTLNPVPAASPSPEPRAPSPSSSNSPWSPSGDDHLIYEWVVMQGKTQSEVAGMLKVHQSTISRVIQRYDRWRAHMKARENGALDHTERLRAQHQLTFERNELILASCLRIAKEMEGFVDTSKSTISRPLNNYAKENEVRTVHATLDRTGMAARFYRLAFRINMEQLKLAAQDELPPAEPLTDQQLAQEADIAASDAAELATFFGRFRADPPPTTDPGVNKPDQTDETQSSLPGSPLVTLEPEGPPSEPTDQLAIAATSPTEAHSSTCNVELETCNSVALHNLHNENADKIAATPSKPCTCASHQGPREKSSVPCITTLDPPPWTDEPHPETSVAALAHTSP